MKTKNTLVLILVTAGILFLNACKKETQTVPSPVVSLTELGYENSKTGYIGSDLHVEADIVAEGVINAVKIEIHQEGSGTWEFDTAYTKFSGLKNATFHEHIDIPLTTEAGDYHFHLVVTDMEGNQVLTESELTIQQPTDTIVPQITISSAPSGGQTFSNGETISISGSVSDNIALGGMYIGLVREGQNLTDTDVNATNTITLLHSHDFNSPTNHHYSASIVVGATMDNNDPPKAITGDIAWQSANYYILVKCEDAFGGNWTYSSRYPIIIK